MAGAGEVDFPFVVGGGELDGDVGGGRGEAGAVGAAEAGPVIGGGWEGGEEEQKREGYVFHGMPFIPDGA